MTTNNRLKRPSRIRQWIHLAIFVASLTLIVFATVNLIGSICWLTSYRKLQTGIRAFFAYFPPPFEETDHEHDKDFIRIDAVNDSHNNHNRSSLVQDDFKDNLRMDDLQTWLKYILVCDSIMLVLTIISSILQFMFIIRKMMKCRCDGESCFNQNDEIDNSCACTLRNAIALICFLLGIICIVYYVAKTIIVLDVMFHLIDYLRISITEIVTTYAPRNDAAREQLQIDFNCVVYVDGRGDFAKIDTQTCTKTMSQLLPNSVPPKLNYLIFITLIPFVFKMIKEGVKCIYRSRTKSNDREDKNENEKLPLNELPRSTEKNGHKSDGDNSVGHRNVKTNPSKNIPTTLRQANKPTTMLSRAKGCFYGLAIGDALGSRYEFRKADIVRQMIADDRLPSGFLPMLGGGPISAHPGQVTDDTEMAMALARSLARLGHYDNADVACSYVRWRHTFSPGTGKTTKQALSNIDMSDETKEALSTDQWHMHLSDDEKRRIELAVIANASKYNMPSLSNGCLMRISPLAIASTRLSIDNVRRIVEANCALTNPNPIAIDAVRVYVLAIQGLLLGENAQTCYQSALQSSESLVIRSLLHDAADRAVPVRLSDSAELIDGDWRCIGYLGVALQSAFYELLHADSFADAVENAIARGGDTDTNGCIVGAMLGAKFGIDDIAPEWIDAVKSGQKRSNVYSEVRLDDGDALVEQLISSSIIE